MFSPATPLVLAALALVSAGDDGTRVTVNPDGVLVIDGAPVFPIGFTEPPPPDGLTPDGTDALAELRDAGATFLGRTGASGGPWTEETIAMERRWQDAAARHGLYCWVHLRELSTLGADDPETEAMLRRVVERFKDHPGMGVWKSTDEPAWVGAPVADVLRASDLIRALDPDHPLQITHAPRNTLDELRAYNDACELVATDIYPVGYPPGRHSLEPHKEISMVGDYTRKTMAVAGGEKGVWMVLQIAWSGVIKPGKTLRFPTHHQERFMAYEAIIHGARGLFFFGGHIPKAMSPEDAALGWNWTFWDRVLRPVIAEIGDRSPLYPALIAPDSPLELSVEVLEAAGGPAEPSEVEFLVREAGDSLFLLACKREGATVRVAFRGLPSWAADGEVLYESPRAVTAADGSFNDWFGPFDVHVYRFPRPGGADQ